MQMESKMVKAGARTTMIPLDPLLQLALLVAEAPDAQEGAEQEPGSASGKEAESKNLKPPLQQR